MKAGIDISGWNPPPYPKKDFYIFKATEGVGWKSDQLDSNFNWVMNNIPGANYGFYHYGRPDLKNSALEEANWFIKTVGHHKGKAVYALDWEGKALEYSPDWALAFLDYVKNATGAHPLLYTSASEINSGKYSHILNHGFPLWVAHTGVDKPGVTVPWAVWQYEGDPLDKDYLNNSTSWEFLTGAIISDPLYRKKEDENGNIIFEKC